MGTMVLLEEFPLHPKCESLQLKRHLQELRIILNTLLSLTFRTTLTSGYRDLPDQRISPNQYPQPTIDLLEHVLVLV